MISSPSQQEEGCASCAQRHAGDTGMRRLLAQLIKTMHEEAPIKTTRHSTHEAWERRLERCRHMVAGKPGKRESAVHEAGGCKTARK